MLVPPWESLEGATPAQIAIFRRYWDFSEFLLLQEAAVGTGRVNNGENSLCACIERKGFRTVRVLFVLGVQLVARALELIYPCNTLDECEVKCEVMQGLEEAWRTENLDSLNNIIRMNPLSHDFLGTPVVKIGKNVIEQVCTKTYNRELEDQTHRFQFYTAALRLVCSIFPGVYCSKMTLAFMKC